jgi:hypothetical protein
MIFIQYLFITKQSDFFKMDKIVLIGDIVSSRKIQKRRQIQNKLNKIFEKINERGENISSRLTITLGDEFQAVYSKADFIFKHIWQIILSIYPEKLRFSLGLGGITTALNPIQAIGMDGPAFYNARKGLDEIKQTYFQFNITGNDKANLKLIKQSLFLLSHISYNWKETRLMILSMMYEHVSISEISKKIKITDKAVYKNVDAGALQTVIKFTNELSKNINSMISKK